ncbi:60S acidic ribosomal protein P1 [Wickerhamiella sorbophila]|uniref:60S acidic ribosomal protein P1 n=1 Tax=Wickerhamiella sorbophila TaxID=45607 RepID=A0A2T0FCS2_9ASCO|nr:60S acidic ribosomal protein P1 [Wickerhamiella sorbophila]PRT52796.1 60S acidic ribosomal protein P1 [Wickerhamiella sorbophila]
MSNLAVSYAAVILADSDLEITADKLIALTEAAKIEGVEPIFAQLYAKAIGSVNTKELLTAFASAASAGPVAGGAVAAAGGAGAAAEAEAEPEKEEEESDGDMGMGLFD